MGDSSRCNLEDLQRGIIALHQILHGRMENARYLVFEPTRIE